MNILAKPVRSKILIIPSRNRKVYHTIVFEKEILGIWIFFFFQRRRRNSQGQSSLKAESNTLNILKNSAFKLSFLLYLKGSLQDCSQIF